MKIEQILDTIRSLAMSTGLYGRLYEEIMRMPDKERQDYFNFLESLHFKTDLDIVLYFEENKFPEGYERPAMTDQEIKRVVAGQLVAMIENNIINGYGIEDFNGWLENGDVFFNMGMTEEEINRAMAIANALANSVDTINQLLGE